MNTEEDLKFKETSEGPKDQPEDAPAPVQIKRILDGTAFIQEMNGAPLPELHPHLTCQGEILIRDLGQSESTAILCGQFRDNGDGAGKEWDQLGTLDRVQCVTVQQCVVNENREPIYKPAQVSFMFGGKDQAKFRQFFDEAYAGCLLHNPQLDVSKNGTALQKLFRA